MPLLQTLEIEEVISEKQAEQQRSRHKRIVLAMSSSARNFSMGVRRRMNEADTKARDVDEKGRIISIGLSTEPLALRPSVPMFLSVGEIFDRLGMVWTRFRTPRDSKPEPASGKAPEDTSANP